MPELLATFFCLVEPNEFIYLNAMSIILHHYFRHFPDQIQAVAMEHRGRCYTNIERQQT